MLDAENETQQDRNVAIVRRFIDGWVNAGELDVIDQTWADDMTWHGGSLGTYQGRDASNSSLQPTQPVRSPTCTSRSTNSSRRATRSSPDSPTAAPTSARSSTTRPPA